MEKPEDVTLQTWRRIDRAGHRIAAACGCEDVGAIVGALLEVYYLAVRDAVSHVSQHFPEKTT